MVAKYVASEPDALSGGDYALGFTYFFMYTLFRFNVTTIHPSQITDVKTFFIFYLCHVLLFDVFIFATLRF